MVAAPFSIQVDPNKESPSSSTSDILPTAMGASNVADSIGTDNVGPHPPLDINVNYNINSNTQYKERVPNVAYPRTDDSAPSTKFKSVANPSTNVFLTYKAGMDVLLTEVSLCIQSPTTTPPIDCPSNHEAPPSSPPLNTPFLPTAQPQPLPITNPTSFF